MSETVPFSARIQSATARQHEQAENSSFIGDMLGGALGIDSYHRYTGQLWFVYRALESRWEELAADPVAGPFIKPELARTAELERDLAALLGTNWRAEVTPLPATRTYAERIEECARDWPAGYVAHHYTRYLGDLSGGQVIRGTAEKLWDLPRRGDGVRFYVFDGIANPAAFKREYRALLDDLNVDELERRRVLEESQRAFDYNTALFAELAAEFPARRPS
ncbi:biliverdin-producing heme oxygenase [Nocardia puris]|uniref:Heme oxygenase n=1 Tax=Nocardia puris TaxID=208602 RepID=A0A366DX58_9NOCA|nr:biliverdin-producing heme oxygenase [Nocardia puris]MBF6210345.1 biliverdin-producing heme oxygenase [Nocardia puris]MBF6367420.1 biliverdin-producing heme oxygenase [Nocardia puris]MBF6457605.1 biliverdin-producing heme oxygenase [Nocardia puris]RBO93768.1 heme oxygenase [Nocardia puris]